MFNFYNISLKQWKGWGETWLSTVLWSVFKFLLFLVLSDFCTNMFLTAGQWFAQTYQNYTSVLLKHFVNVTALLCNMQDMCTLLTLPNVCGVECQVVCLSVLFLISCLEYAAMYEFHFNKYLLCMCCFI